MKAREIFEGYLNGNYAPLYHSTNLLSAIEIVKDNKLDADRNRESRLTHDHRDIANAHGFVSLTRSLHYAQNRQRAPMWSSCWIKTNFRQDYRLKPFDYYDYIKKFNPQPEYLRSESEEYTIKSIEPLDKYLIEILVSKAGVERVKKIILNQKTSVPKDPSKPWTALNNKMVKQYSGLNDPKIADDPVIDSWVDRAVLLKNKKVRFV